MLRKQNAKKFFFAGITAVIIVLAACPGPNDSGPVPPPDITWTAVQDGGVNYVTTSTGIKITFDRAVPNLNHSQVTVTGAASLGDGFFESDSGDTEWILPVNVTAAGIATVTISRNGVEEGPRNVGVFFEGELTTLVGRQRSTAYRARSQPRRYRLYSIFSMILTIRWL